MMLARQCSMGCVYDSQLEMRQHVEETHLGDVVKGCCKMQSKDVDLF
jgi:hypothetical protein